MCVVAHWAQLIMNGSLRSACVQSVLFCENARWQCRPSYERTPHSRAMERERVRCLDLQHLCGSHRLQLSWLPLRRHFPRIALSLRGQDATRGHRPSPGDPSFVWRSVELLDLIKGRHALLLDIQRLDPRRCFALRISRQGSAVSFISLSHFRKI